MSSMRFFDVFFKDPTAVFEINRAGQPDQLVARFYGDDAEKQAEEYCAALNNEEEVKMGDDL